MSGPLAGDVNVSHNAILPITVHYPSYHPITNLNCPALHVIFFLSRF